jgi:Mycothiol maleylpyruvate isomerase N-terminal domain
MANPRKAYSEALDNARTVLASERTAERWESESVLADFSVRGLAGHLCRCVIAPLEYLEAEEPRDESPIDGVDYFTAAVPTSDVNAEVNVDVRDRGEQISAGGHAATVALFDAAHRKLEPMLAVESPARLVRVFAGLVMRLDDYLETRIVEALVHTEDLALSIGMPAPAPPQDALDIAIEHLVGVARRRHGDVAIVSALTRRERDDVDALRVF